MKKFLLNWIFFWGFVGDCALLANGSFLQEFDQRLNHLESALQDKLDGFVGQLNKLSNNYLNLEQKLSNLTGTMSQIEWQLANAVASLNKQHERNQSTDDVAYVTENQRDYQLRQFNNLNEKLDSMSRNVIDVLKIFEKRHFNVPPTLNKSIKHPKPAVTTTHPAPTSKLASEKKHQVKNDTHGIVYEIIPKGHQNCRGQQKLFGEHSSRLTVKFDEIIEKIQKRRTIGEGVERQVLEVRRRMSNETDEAENLDEKVENMARIVDSLLVSCPNTPTARGKIDAISDCSELPPSYPNGVYQLKSSPDLNKNNRDYNRRHCVTKIMNHVGNTDDVEEAGWTLIQQRGYHDSTNCKNGKEVNFNQPWEVYKHGFGDLDGDFWLGNDYIHRMTMERDIMLRIELEDFTGNVAWAEYNEFKVGDESEKYVLTVADYRGNASDSLSAHNGTYFSTYDMNNDGAPECCPCAPIYGSGWWFFSCFEANLNGIYHANPTNNGYFKGIIWEHWLGNYSLKRTRMLVRPRPNKNSSKH